MNPRNQPIIGPTGATVTRVPASRPAQTKKKPIFEYKPKPQPQTYGQLRKVTNPGRRISTTCTIYTDPNGEKKYFFFGNCSIDVKNRTLVFWEHKCSRDVSELFRQVNNIVPTNSQSRWRAVEGLELLGIIDDVNGRIKYSIDFEAIHIVDERWKKEKLKMKNHKEKQDLAKKLGVMKNADKSPE